MVRTLPDKLPLDIVQFIQHPELLKDSSHSKAQLTALKSLYGLALTPAEMEIYSKGTGTLYVPQEKNELTLIAGRRSGKTSKLAAPIAAYESFRGHGLAKNEEAFVMLFGPTMKQAGIAFRAISRYISSSPILSRSIIGSTHNELRLDNGVVIGCFARTHDSVRGRTVIVAILDEIAFWSDGPEEGDSVEQVIDALRPGMVMARAAKLIKLSTPFLKSGVLYFDYTNRRQLTFPVWQLPTAQMNPAVKPAALAEELIRNEEKFRREFQAEFTDTTHGWIASELLEPCVVRGRAELPFHAGKIYAAALDPASRRHDFVLAILHKERDGTIVVDKIARWTGTKSAPLAFEHVLGEVKSILASYEINSACGDQYYCDAISQHLLKLEITYNVSNFNAHTRSALFLNLKHLLAQNRIELLDDPELLRQLRNLRQEKTERGQLDVRPVSGSKDDLAIAVALAANELCKQRPEPRPTPFEIADNNALRLIPGDCAYEARCENFSTCMDEDFCKGFRIKGLGLL